MKNKYFIALVIAIIMLIIALAITSCCPPEKDVMSGKAVEKHYRHHKFTAYRATYHREGNLWVVRLENKSELRKEIWTCKPNCKNGGWINL